MKNKASGYRHSSLYQLSHSHQPQQELAATQLQQQSQKHQQMQMHHYGLAFSRKDVRRGEEQISKWFEMKVSTMRKTGPVKPGWNGRGRDDVVGSRVGLSRKHDSQHRDANEPSGGGISLVNPRRHATPKCTINRLTAQFQYKTIKKKLTKINRYFHIGYSPINKAYFPNEKYKFLDKTRLAIKKIKHDLLNGILSRQNDVEIVSKEIGHVFFARVLPGRNQMPIERTKPKQAFSSEHCIYSEVYINSYQRPLRNEPQQQHSNMLKNTNASHPAKSKFTRAYKKLESKANHHLQSDYSINRRSKLKGEFQLLTYLINQEK